MQSLTQGSLPEIEMSKVLIEERGDVAILRLSNEVTNAISPDVVNDFSAALGQVRARFKGMVLAGNAKFFSIGVDLPALLKLDRSSTNSFWYSFNQIVFEIFTLPLPTICAISGHAVAGGMILALACDYRFAISEKKQIGLNEVKLGLPVPYLADLILRQVVGDRPATEMLYLGEFMSLSDGREIGLIDRIYSPEIVEDQAVKMAAELAGFHGPAFAAIKANRVETIRARYEDNFRSRNQIFLDCWFSEPVQKLLKEASKKF